jgi:SWI/SNF-related matrix-associated actin-dependent regulator 1 of chromatin subfamily A
VPDALELAALSRAIAPPPDYAPDLRYARLFPYQHAAVSQEPYRKHMLLAHPPGAGKTPMALALASGVLLIVCPPSIALQWARKHVEWSGTQIDVADRGMLVAKLLDGQSAIVPDSLVHLIPPFCRYDTVIVDEVHRLKTRDARRTKAIFGGREGKTVLQGVVQRSGRVFALTGTPLQNSPIDLYPFLALAAPTVAPSFEAFTQRYCPPVSMSVPGSPYPIKRYDQKMQNLDELAFKLRATVMIRPPASECLAQLPPLIEDVYHLGGVEDPAKGELSIEQVADVFEGNQAPEQIKQAISLLRRETGLAKAKSLGLVAWLSELIDGGERPILWCWHQEVAAYLALKLELGLIHGGIPMLQREATIASYVAGSIPGIAMTIGAAGTGVDGLQRSGRLCIFVEQSYVPGDNEQAVGRLYRTGQTQGVRVVRVKTALTIDRAIEAILRRKNTMIEETLR